MEIGKCGTDRVVETPCIVAIGSESRLERIVNEIDGEELVKDIEIPTALHFFGIPADDGFRGIG